MTSAWTLRDAPLSHESSPLEQTGTEGPPGVATDPNEGGGYNTAPESSPSPAESTHSSNQPTASLTNVEETPGRISVPSSIPEENSVPLPVPPRTSRPTRTSHHSNHPSAGNTPHVTNAILEALTRIRDSTDATAGQFFERDVADVERTLTLARQLGGRHTEEPRATEAAIVEEIYRIRRSTSPTPPPPNTRENTHLPARRTPAVVNRSGPPPQRQARNRRGSGGGANNPVVETLLPLHPSFSERAELLHNQERLRAQTPPPLGFDYNRGSNYVPCLITTNDGLNVNATYVRVVMTTNPYVVGRVRGDSQDYRGPLHAEPQYEPSDRPRYTADDWW